MVVATLSNSKSNIESRDSLQLPAAGMSGSKALEGDRLQAATSGRNENNAIATDERLESEDKLSALPTTTSSSPVVVCVDNNNTRQKEEQQQGDDDEEEEEQDAVGQVNNSANSVQFNRLDPNRRSFSTPTIAAATKPQHQLQQQAKAANKEALAQAQLSAAAWPKQKGSHLSASSERRRTALGLISSTGSVNWRLWFGAGANGTGNGASKQEQLRSKRLLLRNLRPQTTLGGFAAMEEAQQHRGATKENTRTACSQPNRTRPSSSQLEPEQHEAAEEPAEVEREQRLQPGQQVFGANAASMHQSCASQPEARCEPLSLVERLIDSKIEWRHLIKEANGGERSLNSLSELQIKRQEVIHELIQTERHHCLTLALMRQVYYQGLRKLNETRSTASLSSLTNSNSINGNNKQSSQSTTTLLTSSTSLHLNHHYPQLNKQQLLQTDGSQQAADLIDLERLFPALDDLIQAHELFFAHLRLKLVESCRKQLEPSEARNNTGDNGGRILGLVGPIGDLLCDQFRLFQAPQGERRSSGGDNNTDGANPASQGQQGKKGSLHQLQQQPGNGHKLLQAYSKFCGQHSDSSRYYKHLLQSDKGFKQFIETCNRQNSTCRQRGIPECNLLVTQRLTKYPLLIEQLIKTSVDNPLEESRLRDALRECKSLLAELNNQLARKESFERLLDIYAQFSPKSYTIFNQHLKFTKHDLLQHKRLRQLIHSDGQVRVWSATRRKLFQVLCLILNDIIVFLRIESSSSTSNSSSSNSLAASSANNAVAAALHFGNQPAELHLGAAGSCGVGLESSSFQPNESQPPVAQPISQCALINVVASAFQASSSHHAHLLHSPLNSLLVQQQQASQQTSSTNHISPSQLKYYFANIDNKPSVISLSKLLIREKAAHDGEPRIYLISSSPRQPEMYELAFLTKRHQLNFVEKLKACIEQHNRSLEIGLESDEEETLEGEQQARTCGCADLEQEQEQEEDHELSTNYDECLNSYSGSAALEQSDEEGEGSISSPIMMFVDAIQCPETAQKQSSFRSKIQCAARSDSQQPLGGDGRRRSRTMDELDLERLDIEQDVVLPPSSKATSSSSSSEHDNDEQSSSFVYETPRACHGRRQFSLPPEEAGLEECNAEASHSSVGTASSVPEVGEDEPADESHESGLSERAKDSLDEAAPSKQKLRTTRRRRIQRPRNVSNQSSSSSEAAHRQAIELISGAVAPKKGAIELAKAAATAPTTPAAAAADYEEESDSGRGHDSSSSASSASGRTEVSDRKLADTSCKLNKASPQASGKLSYSGQKALPKLELNKLLKGAISLSTSSISSSTQTGSISTSSCAQLSNGGSATAALVGATASSSAPADRSCCSEQQRQDSVSLTKTSSKTSILSKSSFMKQRKLSTVSTMSSQLNKLFKNELCLHCNNNSNNNHNNNNNNGQQIACRQMNNHSSGCLSQQSTLSKQMRQQIRRSSFIPEQKLEELRDLQIQLDRDKQEWQAKFDKMQEQLLNERRELDLAREKLKLDRRQVANEREQLYRKLDVLKENGILLSPSHKVIITTPEMRIYPPPPQVSNKQQPFGDLRQQQQVACANSTMQLQQQNQRQRHALQSANANQSPHYLSSSTSTSSSLSSSSSIRIIQQQAPQQQLQAHLLQHQNQQLARNERNHHQSTNLIIQSSAIANKVPLHLSNGDSKQQSNSKSAWLTPCKMPIFSAFSASLLGGGSPAGSGASASANGTESHLI